VNFRPRHISPEDFQVMQNKVRGAHRADATAGSRSGGDAKAGTDLAKRPGHRQLDKLPPSPFHGYRSKLEYNWANYLDVLKAVKDIEGWQYEPLRFKLPGEKNYYKIDFSAWTARTITFYEVKGVNKSDDASLVKLKTAAGLNPWARFVLVKCHDGQWDERVIV